jgi:hypothetical protein
MRGRIAAILVAACLVATVGHAQQVDVTELYAGAVTKKAQRARVPSGVGTVQYDPGAPPDSIATGGALILYGNQFNSRNGSPLSSGTVTRISWYAGPGVTFSPVWFAPGGGNATWLGCCFSIASNTFNSVSLTLAVPNSFFVGIHAGQGLGQPGMRSASTNGQGFHALNRNPTVGSTIILSIQNVMVRVSGDVIIPVELLEFEVE